MLKLKEYDVMLIERAEEATLRDLVKTEVSASCHLLYLELEIIPARFVVKQRKVWNKTHIAR